MAPALPGALLLRVACVVMEASQEDMTPKQILETLKKRCGSITKDESGSPRWIGVPGGMPAGALAAVLAAAEARVAEARAAAAEGRRASMPTTLAPLAEATPLAEADAGPPSAARACARPPDELGVDGGGLARLALVGRGHGDAVAAPDLGDSTSGWRLARRRGAAVTCELE